MATLVNNLADIIKKEGIKNIFGYPGGGTIALTEAANKAELNVVTPKTEGAAAYMASITGELTGTPGIVFSTLGPGATNLVNGVSQALLDRNPLIAITGRHGFKAGNSNHQKLPQVSIFEPITKWNTTLTADGATETINRAFRVATAERPGPVHFDLPGDQGGKECDTDDYTPISSIQVTYGDVSKLDHVINKLQGSKRPLILAGPSVVRLNGHAELAKLAEQWGIPVVTTVKAKGVIDERSPYSAGAVDMAGSKQMKEFIKSSDLLLAIGFDAVELIGKWGVNVPTIHIDSVPNTDLVYFAEIEIIGNIPGILENIAKESVSVPKWSEDEVVNFKTNFWKSLLPDTSEMIPSSVALAAREVLPEEAIVVTDTGSHKVLLGQFWPTYQPKTYFVSNGLGTMGFGIPGAIAAKLHSPDKPVVCFTGDGGFAMVSSELATAAELGLPIVVVVFNDGSLDRIVRKQEALNMKLVGTKFKNPNFSMLAESYGVSGHRVESIAEFSKVLDNAIKQNHPTLIEVPISNLEYAFQYGK